MSFIQPALARQEHTLRFYAAPADYAHPSWWPAAFGALAGSTASPTPQAAAHLSRWMIGEYQLGAPHSAAELAFDQPATRFWLLPPELVRRVAVDIGAALRRNLIRHCISRASREQLNACFGADTLDFALSEAAAALAPPPRSPRAAERVPGFAECALVGGCMLLRTFDPAPPAQAQAQAQARLLFPRAWRMRSSSSTLPAPALLPTAVDRALQLQPSWRWLFC
jgi:hypothetical protein